MVRADFAHGPDQFFFERRVRVFWRDGGEVEPDIAAEAEAFDFSEGERFAELAEAHVREDEARVGCLHREQHELADLGGVPGFVAVEQQDEVEFAGARGECGDGGIGDVEVLRVGMKLDDADAEGGDAREFVVGGLAVHWVDGGDGEEAAVAGGGRGDDGVVLLTHAVELALAGHHDECALGDAGFVVEALEFGCAERLRWQRAIVVGEADVGVGVDDGLGRGGRRRCVGTRRQPGSERRRWRGA